MRNRQISICVFVAHMKYFNIWQINSSAHLDIYFKGG